MNMEKESSISPEKKISVNESAALPTEEVTATTRLQCAETLASLQKMDGASLLALYREKHRGVTQRQLKKEDPLLRQALDDCGWLKYVPTVVSVDDLLVLCHRKYQGITRSKLARIDAYTYKRLRAEKRTGDILRAGDPTINNEEIRQQLLAEYHTNHPGETRGQLKRTNRRLHSALKKYGLLEQIPLQSNKKRNERMNDILD
jgi:hypothetical protein